MTQTAKFYPELPDVTTLGELRNMPINPHLSYHFRLDADQLKLNLAVPKKIDGAETRVYLTNVPGTSVLQPTHSYTWSGLYRPDNVAFVQKAELPPESADRKPGVAITWRRIEYADNIRVYNPTAEDAENIKYAYFKRTTNEIAFNNMIYDGQCIGSDPEVFIVDEKERLFPAHLVLKNKDSLTQGSGKIYNDGFAMEMAPRAESCLAYHVDRIATLYQTIYTLVKEYNVVHGTKLRISARDYIPCSKMFRTNLPNEIVQLGCAPSYSAYGDKHKFRSGQLTPYRTAGAHIHIQMMDPNSAGKRSPLLNDREFTDNLCKFVDLVAGILHIALVPNQDPRRRKLYGRAGEYRLPKHGFEYRVLSSRIMAHPALVHFSCETVRAAAKGYMKQYDKFFPVKVGAQEVRRIINTIDVPAARQLIQDNIYLYYSTIAHICSFDKFARLLKYKEGFGSIVNLTDEAIVTNWNMNGKWLPHSEGRDCNFGRLYC